VEVIKHGGWMGLAVRSIGHLRARLTWYRLDCWSHDIYRKDHRR
jgi:hypothetical protein